MVNFLVPPRLENSPKISNGSILQIDFKDLYAFYKKYKSRSNLINLCSDASIEIPLSDKMLVYPYASDIISGNKKERVSDQAENEEYRFLPCLRL